MEKQKVIFVCIHNSARSQMAEAFLNNLGGNKFVASSAGIEPGSLNPVAVEAMAELGMDISNNKTKDINYFLSQNSSFDFAITVCDDASAERCPVFPGNGKRLHWSFPDPSGFQGTPVEKLSRTRQVRDAIKARILEFINSGQ